MEKSLNANSQFSTKGWTEIRLYDTKKFQEMLRVLGVQFSDAEKAIQVPMVELVKRAKASNLSANQIGSMLDQCAKPLFNVNAFWKFLKRRTGKDVVIPFVTGMWTTRALKMNTVTTKGKSIAAQQFGGTTTAPVTGVAIGIGTGGTTTLNSEITTNGGQRAAATVSNQTTSLTGDTERYILTYTFTGSFAITEEGLFDNNTSGGNMACYQSFSAINVVSTDNLQVTHNVQFS